MSACCGCDQVKKASSLTSVKEKERDGIDFIIQWPLSEKWIQNVGQDVCQLHGSTVCRRQLRVIAKDSKSV